MSMCVCHKHEYVCVYIRTHVLINMIIDNKCVYIHAPT